MTQAMRFDIDATDRASAAFLKLADNVERLERKLKELDRTEASPKIDVRTKPAERKLREFADELKAKLADHVVEVDADTTAAGQKVDQLKTKLAVLRNVNIRVAVDVADSAGIAGLRADLASLSNATVRVDVNIADSSGLATLRADMAALSNVDVRVDLDADAAIAKVTAVGSGLAGLSNKSIKLDVDTGTALLDLTAIEQKMLDLKLLSPLRLRVEVDDQATADLTAIEAVAAALASATPTIRVDADTAVAAAQLAALQAQVAALGAASPTVRINLDSLTFLGQLARIQTELSTLAGGTIVINADTRGLMEDLARARVELARLQSLDPTVTVQADTELARHRIELLEAQLVRIAGKQYRAEVKVDVDRALSAFGLLAKGAAAAGAGILALGALPQLASLGAAAVTAAGSLWLLPAVLTTVGVGFAALKIATSGFGDALKNIGDPKKFAESIKGLAPAARDAAVAVKGLKPAFDALKLDVQNRLFTQLGPAISKLGGTYLPILHERFARVADAANEAALGIVQVLQSTTRVDDIKSIGSSAATVFENLGAAVKPLAGAFIDIAQVGGKVLADLTAGAGSAATRFAEFIAKARDTQQLEGWMRRGVDALKQLGTIAGNVGSTLGGIFKAAQASGADFLGTMARATGAVKDFVQSAQGQTTITNVFKAIREAVDAATPGVKALATAVSEVINKIADTGALEKLGSMFSSLAETVGPIASTLANLAVSAIGPLAQAIGALAPVLGPVATGLLGMWAAAKLMSGINSITPMITGFITAIRGIGTAAASGGAMAGIRALAGSLGAGGILGLALGAAGLALGIWASSQSDAAGAVADHQAAVDNLAGTLDKFTGAATAATAAEQAHELTTRKLSDGTTSLADALRDAGISSSDFVQATSGNQAKLEQVNGTLHSQAKAVIEGSDAWKKMPPLLAQAGISLDVATDAALGNVQAQDQLDAAAKRVGMSSADFLDTLKAQIGPLAEIGSNLGDMSGKLAEAQKNTRDAGAAAKDFGDVLAALKPGLAGLAGGAPPLEAMVAGFKDLGASASTSAQKLGEAAAQTGGVTAGAKAAGDAMQASRDQFVAAATAALGSKEAAEALANSIGLIPAAARINFETNATGAAAEVNTLKAQFDAVPGTKTVTVDALTTDAQAMLRSLGFEVKALPNGQFEVVAKTDNAKAALDAFVAGESNKSATVNINGNTVPAATALQTIMGAIAAGQGTVTINGNPVPTQVALAGVLGQINAGAGTVTVNGQAVPAQQALSAYISAVNSANGTATINGQSVPAQAILAAFVGRTNGSSGTVKIGAVDTGAVATAQRVVAIINAMRATVKIVASVTPGAAAGMVYPAFAKGGVHRFAKGGVQAFATGGLGAAAGVPGAAEFHAGRAQVFPPNRLRITGDRIHDDEFYIPDDDAPRSLALLGELARRRGFSLVPRALSGMSLARAAPTSAGITRVSVMSQSGGGARPVVDLGPVVSELRGLRPLFAAAAQRQLTLQQTINNYGNTQPAAQSGAEQARTLSDMGAW